MTIDTDLGGLGTPTQVAAVLGANTLSAAPTRSVSAALTATGTVLADALLLASFHNVVTTAAASTGVKLPSTCPIGSIVTIQNNGANILNVFPHSASGTINAGSAGAAITTAVAAGAICIRNSSLDWTVWVTAKEA